MKGCLFMLCTIAVRIVFHDLSENEIREKFFSKKEDKVIFDFNRIVPLDIIGEDKSECYILESKMRDEWGCWSNSIESNINKNQVFFLTIGRPPKQIFKKLHKKRIHFTAYFSCADCDENTGIAISDDDGYVITEWKYSDVTTRNIHKKALG